MCCSLVSLFIICHRGVKSSYEVSSSIGGDSELFGGRQSWFFRIRSFVCGAELPNFVLRMKNGGSVSLLFGLIG